MIFTIVMLLIAGAALNVAVAWGLAAWIPMPERYTEVGFGHHRWPIAVPATFPPHWEHGVVSASLGYRYQDCVEVAFASVAPSESVIHKLTVIHAGLPMKCLHGGRWEILDFPARTTDTGFIGAFEAQAIIGGFVPRIPLWPGFAINTLFYAAVLWMLFAIPFALRRMIRRRRGRCAACNYPIGQSPVCTECGNRVEVSALSSGHHEVETLGNHPLPAARRGG